MELYNDYQLLARHVFRKHVIHSVSNLIALPLTDELVHAWNLLLTRIPTGDLETTRKQWIEQSDLGAEGKQMLSSIVNSIAQCLDELSKLEITEYQKQDVFNIVKEQIENILPISVHDDSPRICMP